MTTSRLVPFVLRQSVHVKLLISRNVIASARSITRIPVRSAACAPSSANLDSLIASLTEEKNSSVESPSLLTVNAALMKKFSCKLNEQISYKVVSDILIQCAVDVHESEDLKSIIQWIKRDILTRLDEQSTVSELNMTAILETLSALLSLEMHFEPIFDKLVDALRSHFSSDMVTTSVSSIIRFAALVNSKNIRLPSDIYMQVRESIQLKSNEISKPEDIVTVMICWNKNDNWFNVFIEKAKTAISAMSIGELVGVMASLANNGSRPAHVLRLICAAFDNQQHHLTPNQLVTLVKSSAKLSFMDVRLRHLIASETLKNISCFTKWSQIDLVVESLAKLRLGDTRVWNALAAWINNNQMNANFAELSFAFHWCAIAGFGKLVEDTFDHIRKQLEQTSNIPARARLSSVYSLAICNSLTASLAQSVLQPSFIENVLKDSSQWQKLMILTTLSQIQALLKLSITKACDGHAINIVNYMKIASTAVDEMSLKLRYGKNESSSVQHFHSLINKLIPVNKYTLPPTLNDDGIFVNAVVKFDVEEDRFIPLCEFESSKIPSVAMIFASWRDKTVTCRSDDESKLMGPISLSLRLLEARGLVPVLYSHDEFDSGLSLNQQIELIKNKVEEAYIGLKKFGFGNIN